MQFILEIIALFFIFLLFRQAVIRAFPVKAVGLPLSDDSTLALKKYRRRYLILFWTSGIVLSFFIMLGLHELFYQLHARGSEGNVLIIERTALYIPAIILGFLLGTFLSRWLNSRMQHDGLSFFFEEYHDEWKGFDTNKLRGWHIAGALILAMAMLYTQFHVFAVLRDGEVIWQSPQSGFHVHTINEVESIFLHKQNEFSISFSTGDTLVTEGMDGDKASFVNNIKNPAR